MANLKPVRNYYEIKSRGGHRHSRHVALSFLATFYRLTGRLPSLLSKHRVQFLYFHHVFEDEEEPFRRLLVSLSESHHFISYSEAVDRILAGSIDAPYLCVSFDDGFKNSLGVSRIMNSFGIKGCFFLNTSMIEETDQRKIEYFCSKRLHLPPIEFLSWDDVGFLLEQGHEIGGHTVTHANLAKVPQQEIQDEVNGCYELLSRRIGKVKHFSWPYGRFSDFSCIAARAVFEAGFTSCASAERGCHIARGQLEQNYLCIRRDHIVCQWPLCHVMYFLARNSLVVLAENNTWPKEWGEIY